MERRSKQFKNLNGNSECENVERKTLNEIWSDSSYRLASGINLIIAPCGSGKTYFTFNTLIKEYPLEDIIYLCDTINLKEAILIDKEYSHLCRSYDIQDINNIVKGSEYLVDNNYVTKDKITVMTYAHFGVLSQKHPDAFSTTKLIICDEAHQAIDYHRKFDNEESEIYKSAINTINALSKNAKIVLLTATPYIIKKERIRTIFDFSGHPHIKRLTEERVIKFNTNKEIFNILKEFSVIKQKEKKKMLIYTDRITTVKELVEMCNENNLKSIGVWSLNNKENPMSEYQINCLESIINKSLIPDEIDVMVINASLQTGVNIKNEDIDWILINSSNYTTQVQARSRVRRNIKRLYIKEQHNGECDKIILNDKWLNIPLNLAQKQQLCSEISWFDKRGRIKKWPSISKELIRQGYTLKEVKPRINGKQVKSTIISISK